VRAPRQHINAFVAVNEHVYQCLIRNSTSQRFIYAHRNYTGLTPLSDILAARRISIFGHFAGFKNDVPAQCSLLTRRSADTSIYQSVVLLPATGNDVLVDPALVGQIKFGGTQTSFQLNWRRAIRRGHGAGATQRPSPATRRR